MLKREIASQSEPVALGESSQAIRSAPDLLDANDSTTVEKRPTSKKLLTREQVQWLTMLRSALKPGEAPEVTAQQLIDEQASREELAITSGQPILDPEQEVLCRLADLIVNYYLTCKPPLPTSGFPENDKSSELR